VLEYTYRLEKVERKDGDKFSLTIWPDHCLIGSEGHAIQEDIQKAVREWDINHFNKVVKYIYKVIELDYYYCNVITISSL